jgi:peptidoglycan/LPS O-acetylase OafA/YrhL
VQRRSDIPSLTGLRFVAAAAVVIHHYRQEITELVPAFGFLEPVTAPGNLGVDLFFVLSGFILTYNYLHWFRRLELRPYLRFLGLRLARIYPVHIFTLCLLTIPVIAISALGEPLPHPESYSAVEFLRNVLLINGWTPITVYSWNYVSWSISAEWFAYLLFPLLAFGIVRLQSPILLISSAFGIIAFKVWVIGAFGLGDYALVQIAGDFLMGCFLGQLFLMGWRPAWRWHRLSALCGILIVAIVVGFPVIGLDYNWVVVLFGPLILALALGSQSHSWLATRPMIFLGDASYALYMIHAIIGQILFGLVSGPVATAPLAARIAAVVMVLLTIVGCALSCSSCSSDPRGGSCGVCRARSRGRLGPPWETRGYRSAHSRPACPRAVKHREFMSDDARANVTLARWPSRWVGSKSRPPITSSFVTT